MTPVPLEAWIFYGFAAGGFVAGIVFAVACELVVLARGKTWGDP